MNEIPLRQWTVHPKRVQKPIKATETAANHVIRSGPKPPNSNSKTAALIHQTIMNKSTIQLLQCKTLTFSHVTANDFHPLSTASIHPINCKLELTNTIIMLYIEEEEKKVHPIYATPSQQKKKKNLYKSNDRLEIVIRPLAPKKLSVLTPKYRTLCCAEPGRTILSSGKKKKKNFKWKKKNFPKK